MKNKHIDIIDIKNDKAIKFSVHNGNIYCKNFAGESVIVGKSVEEHGYDMAKLYKELGIDEWLQLIQEDACLKGAWRSICQYLDCAKTRLVRQQSNFDEALKFIENNWIKYEDAKLYEGKDDKLEVSIEDIYKLLKLLRGED